MRYSIYITLAVIITAIGGMITYGWFNNWIIIAYQPYRSIARHPEPVTTQKVRIHYVTHCHTQTDEEDRTIIASLHEHERAYHITQQWLATLDESHTLEHVPHVQSVVPSPTGHILYISFDTSPFNTHDSAYAKWRIIESLLTSLRDNDIQAQSFHFLVHHQPIADDHLDFTRPWPREGFPSTTDISTHTSSDAHDTNKKHITIMLDPAGDAQSPGRIIGTCFERGITLQWCQQMKRRIEQHHDDVSVALTRCPGERIEPLQSAAFTNRLGADLCISVHVYPVTYARPHSFVYYFLYHPETDFWHTSHSHLSLVRCEQAHIPYIHRSYELAHTLAYHLDAHLNPHMDVACVTGLPFKPLLGMHTPAIGLEIGVYQEDDWFRYLDAWTSSIEKLIAICKKQ